MKESFFAILIMGLIFMLLACTSDVVNPEKDVNMTETTTELSRNDNEQGYVYVHRVTSSGGNDREKFIWEVLRLSLEATLEDYGPYDIRGYENINQVREDIELIKDTGKITIISDSLNENNLQNLERIPFPILRNILGYRVFFIKAERQDEFRTIHDNAALESYSFGIALGWNDKIILEHAGLEVYEETNYETLYRALEEGYYDIFSRGVNEIIGEYETYKDQYPDLHIEDSILLYYPLPRYFWFSKSERGLFLKERVEVGLKRIAEDGTFYELFDSYFAEMLKELNLEKRTLIRLENPIYKEAFDKEDTPYRFSPLEDETEEEN